MMNKTTANNPTRNDSVHFSELCLIISVKEARKLLGQGAKRLDDEEVLKLIQELTELASILLKYKHFVK